MRTFVGLTLTAACCSSTIAIFFTYALVLTKFYAVSARGDVGWYILPFALGNFLWAGRLRASIRHPWTAPTISVTYALSGVLLIAVGFAFERDLLSAAAQDCRLDDHVLRRLPAASAAYSSRLW